MKLEDDPSIKNMKETIQSAKNFAGFIGDTFFPNHIPKKPEDVLAMRDRLKQEEDKKQEADQAKQEIKEILQKRKQRIKDIKAERRRKIKRFFGISNTKEANGQP